MEMKKYYYGSALLAVVLAVGAVQPAQAGKLNTGIDALEAALAEAATSLTDEQSTGLYTQRYTAVSSFLDDAEAAVETAKATVPYVYFANVAEKALMYAALQDTQAQLLQYETDVEAINTQYAAGNYTAAQANTALTVKLDTIVDYLGNADNQNAFAATLKDILKEKLDAAMVYDKTGLAALNRAEDAYLAMGQDTTTLVTNLDAAQDAYDHASDSYDTATTYLAAGDTTNAIKYYNQAARRLAVVKGLLLAAQKQINTLEAANVYSPTYTN